MMQRLGILLALLALGCSQVPGFAPLCRILFVGMGGIFAFYAGRSSLADQINRMMRKNLKKEVAEALAERARKEPPPAPGVL